MKRHLPLIAIVSLIVIYVGLTAKTALDVLGQVVKVAFGA